MLFGSNTSNTQGGGLFANLGGQQPQQPAFGGAGGLFGQQQSQSPQQQGGTSLFNAAGFGSNQQQNNQQGFQQTQQTPQLFGALQATPPQQQQQTAGLFGSTATQPAAGLFGKSAFGVQPQQQQGVLFNQQNAPSAFGNAQQLNNSGNLYQNPQQQTGGLFGTQPAQTGGVLFGATQQPQGGTLFGQQPQQSVQQVQGNSWLGQQNNQQPQQSGWGFGGQTQQQQQQQQQQQPNSFGLLGTQSQFQQNTFQCKMLDKNLCRREETSGSSKLTLGVSCITQMPQFKDKSVMELRNEDYKTMKTGQIPDDLKQLIIANSQFQTGQMSQIQFSSMINSNMGAFQQQQPQQSFFQPQNNLQQTGGNSLFGAGFQKQQSGGMLQNTQQGGGPGIFNAINQNQTTPGAGFFNQGNQNQQQSTGLFSGFGAQQQTGGLLGQQQPGGLLGQQQPQQQNSLFGSTNAFGTSQQQAGGSLFGSSTQPQQQQSSFGLFQNTSQPQQQNTAFGFGGAKTDQPQQQNSIYGQTGVKLFGQQQQTQQKPSGLFGNFNQTAQTPAFSQQTQSVQNNNFGQSQQQQAGGLFGNLQSSNQQPQQQTVQLFGSTGMTQQQQPQQQGLFNFGQSQQPQQQTPGLFGSTQQSMEQLNQQTQTQQPLFGQPQSQPQTFGQPQQPPQQEQVNIVIQLPKIDWQEHYSDFFGSIGQDSYNQQQRDLAKFKNVKEYLDFKQYQMKYNPFSESYSWGDSLFKEAHHASQALESQLYKESRSKTENQEDLLEIANLMKSQNNSEQFEVHISFQNQQIQLQIPYNSIVIDVKKRALKELNIQEDTYCYQLISNNELLNDYQRVDWKTINNLEIAIMDKANNDSYKSEINLETSQFKCSKSEFETSPPLYELYRMSQQELKNIKNFKIFNEFGEITFEKSVDLTGIDLSECVNISQNCIEIYTKNQNEKPPIGKGLNVPAILTYYQVKRPQQIDEEKFIQRIKRTAKKNQVEFASFNEAAGILIIKADHF